MDIKKIKLSSEEKKRLQELIAEEEQKLDEQDMDDEQLLEEERLLQQRWNQLASAQGQAPESDQKASIPAPDSRQIEDSWQKLKAKMAADQPASESLGDQSRLYSIFSKKPGSKAPAKRNYQLGIFLAAAAVLLTIYLILPDFKRVQDLGEPDFTFKGTEAPQADLVCDHRVLWHGSEDGPDIQSASLSDDRSAYLIAPHSPIQLASKCLRAGVYAHGALMLGGQAIAVFRNEYITANQWNLLPGLVSEAWVLENGQEAQFVLLMTTETIGDHVQLPSTRESYLEGQSVLEYQQITIRAVSN